MGVPTSMRGYHGIRDAIDIALRRDDIPMLLLLIELEPGAREVNMQRILRRAAFNNNIPMAQAIITEYPRDFSVDMYHIMMMLARDDGNRKFLGWLDTYAKPRIYKYL